MGFESHKLEWEEYEILEHYEHVKHATFLRHGGVSTKHLASLNLGDSVGDNPEHLKINRKKVHDFLGFDHVVYPIQTHGTNVAVITKDNLKHPEADALITNEPGIGLAVIHADCQAAIFYDPEHDAIGIAHVGYKGLVNNIYKNVLGAMQKEFNSKPGNILVAISASLGPECSEYKHYKDEFPKELWSYQETENHFNLWNIARKLLMDAGMHDQNIEITQTCTCCNEKDYFSYRREKDTGRHATYVGLKK